MARVDRHREHRGYDDREGWRSDREYDDRYEHSDEPLPRAVPDDGY